MLYWEFLKALSWDRNCFFSFINDLPEFSPLDTKLFADDSLLYRQIKRNRDAEALQRDLDAHGEWETRWQIKFKPEKCQAIIICTFKRNSRKTMHKLHGHILETVESTKYLGATIINILTLKNHVNSVAAKASRTLGFLSSNLYSCDRDVKESLYTSLVLPTLAYAASVRNIHTSADVNMLGKVQGRGARFTINWEKTSGCMTKMVHALG